MPPTGIYSMVVAYLFLLCLTALKHVADMSFPAAHPRRYAVHGMY